LATRPEWSPDDPKYWLAVLEPKLRQRTKDRQIYENYYEGNHRPMFQTERFRQAFGAMLKELRENWARLVVNTVNERIRVSGFRWEPKAEADTKAWDMWQASHMDAESPLMQMESLIWGTAHLMVDPFVEKGEWPEITAEHSTQMIVAYQPGSRWKRAAALKLWTDEWGEEFATVYQPNQITKFKASGTSGLILPGGMSLPKWAPREVDGENWPLDNPLGVVPVVEFPNRPRLLKGGDSELTDVVPQIDAINTLLGNMMVAAEAAGFPQRWVLGITLQEDPRTGKLLAPFDAGADKIWATEEEAAKFGQFVVAELSNYFNGIKSRVETISAQSRVPAHYFGLIGQWPSGEALRSAETGLTSLCRYKSGYWAEGYEETEILGFRAMGDDAHAQAIAAETLFVDPETRTESEMVDAAVKLKAIGVHDEILQERVGMTAQEIARNRNLMETQPPPEPSTQPPVPQPESAPAAA
jgi:hypothetical protein